VIGIASPAFCRTPFREMLEQVSEHFKLWELLSEGEDRLNLLGEEIAYARTSLGMDFQVHAPLSDVNIGSVHEPMRLAAVDEIKQTISLSRDLDIRMVTIHPGFVSGIAFLDRSLAVASMNRSLKEISSFVGETGVTVALENFPANINGLCTHASELVEALVGTDLGICYDMGHANTSGQMAEFFAIADRFVNVHLHNNEGQWDQHNVIDDGTASLDDVMAALKGRYHGNHIIEATDLESGVRSKAVLEKYLG